MSRSYKKHPWCSISVAGDKYGEKEDKQRCNRTTRRISKVITNEIKKTHIDDVGEENFPSNKRSFESYLFRKDGKQLLDPHKKYEDARFNKQGKLIK